MTVEQIKNAIQELSDEEQIELFEWLTPTGDDPWERQMREDFAAGRLDHVLNEVDRQIENGQTEPGP